MADVQIAIIDQQNTQIALAAPSETQVNAAVPGVQGPAGEGVPQGGTANQVLFKQSGTDYDTAWGEVTSAMIGDLEIVDADVAANAEIAVSKLADGSARQLLQTDAAGTGVEWTSNVDVPGTLDVTGATTLDSTLTVPAGSAAAPTVRFTGDTNTGIYSPGAGQLALSTNGTGRLFVDANGDIDIGSVARIDGTGVVKAQVGSASAPAFSFLNDPDNGMFRPTTNTLAFSTAASERLRITAAGLVGIGTTSPNTLLDLSSNSTTSLRLSNTNGILTQGQITGEIEFQQSDSTGGGTGVSTAIRARSSARPDNGSYFGTCADLGFYVSALSSGAASDNASLEALTIRAGGNVGIGTSSPVSPLTVNQSNGSIGGGLTINSDTAGYPPSLRFRDNVPDTSNLGTLAADRGFKFILGASTEAVRIDSSGRLLVGTSSNYTSYNFQVEGTTYGSSGGTFKHNANSAATGAVIKLIKSRGTSTGSSTIVQNDDRCGNIIFAGTDGSGDVTAASIEGYIDGTPGSNDMPGRLVFSVTADGASSPTEAMRIKNSRILNFANTPVYADNAAAKTGGLVDGDVYRKSDGTLMIVYT